MKILQLIGIYKTEVATIRDETPKQEADAFNVPDNRASVLDRNKERLARLIESTVAQIEAIDHVQADITALRRDLVQSLEGWKAAQDAMTAPRLPLTGTAYSVINVPSRKYHTGDANDVVLPEKPFDDGISEAIEAIRDDLAAEYPPGVTVADHVAHDQTRMRFERSSIRRFLSERAASYD